MPSDLSNAITTVVWDLDDFPVPNGRSINWVCERIKSALKKRGYGGEVSFKGYGDREPLDNLDAFTVFEVQSSKYARLSQMLFDIGFWAMDNSERCHLTGANVMVIAKDTTERSSRFMSLLGFLVSYDFNVLYVMPQNIVPEETPVPMMGRMKYNMWYWESLLDGGKSLDSSSALLLFNKGIQDTKPYRLVFQKFDGSKPCSFCGSNVQHINNVV